MGAAPRWGGQGAVLPAARAGGEPLAEELELNVLCALGCDLVEENVSIRDFQRVGGTVRALGY